MRALPYCTRCGAPVSDEDRFCPWCGQRIRRRQLMDRGDVGSAGTEAYGMVQTTVLGLTVEAVKSIFKPAPVQILPSEAVYARRSHSPMRRYLITAIVLISVGLFMTYGNVWLSYLGLTLSGFTAPVLFLIWLMRNDRYEREPFPLVAMTFGWGVFCGILAAVTNLLFAVPLFGPPGAAFVEEPLKMLGVLWLAMHGSLSAEFNDHLDGMVYGAAAGAGFAGLENLYYILGLISQGGLPPAIAVAVRSATSICHIAWSAFAGRSLGLAKALRGRTHPFDLISGLAVAVPMHFLWNASNPALSLLLLLPFFMLTLYRQMRAAQKDESNWGYLDSAPVE